MGFQTWLRDRVDEDAFDQKQERKKDKYDLANEEQERRQQEYLRLVKKWVSGLLKKWVEVITTRGRSELRSLLIPAFGRLTLFAKCMTFHIKRLRLSKGRSAKNSYENVNNVIKESIID